MAPECSIVRSVTWNWVIEALACSETADLSIFTGGLVNKAPAISGDMGKDLRENVSLKILDRFFDFSTEAKGDDNISKICFDSSRRCQDVLKKIFHEMAELEKEKWDVNKRSSLPKCSLKKLKEAILDDNNPLSVALREKSKLVVSSANSNNDVNSPQGTNAEEYIIGVSTENSNHSESVVKSKDSNNIVQPNNERVDDDEITVIAAKKDAFLKSHIINMDLLPLDEFRSNMEPCMKCNGNGDLLLCSSDSCLLRFHENCLGSTATLDDDGKFLCPFCACSRAISKCQEAERHVSLAKKNIQAFCELSLNRIPKSSTLKQKHKEKDSQLSTEPSSPVILRKKKAKRITPPVPFLGGRKRLRWTNIEEEKLMEGVKRYSSADNKKMPWKEILKFGHDVFDKGRTAVDLKDKWRNLCK